MKLFDFSRFSGAKLLLALILVTIFFLIGNVTNALDDQPAEGPFLYGLGQPDHGRAQPQSTAQSVEETPTQRYLTAPPDLPSFQVERRLGELDAGHIFVNMFDTDAVFRPGSGGQIVGFSLILDNNGEPIYYDRQINVRWPSLDFKKQPNGQITYYDFAGQDSVYAVLNDEYQRVMDYQAARDPESGKKYTVDSHDLQILDNGNALLLIHDAKTFDMSEIVAGGSEEATVIGCIIQEIDANDKLVFQWRSWDYLDQIKISDTNQRLDADVIRYMHCNSIEEDYDGNLLLSSRNLDEVSKIDKTSGDIIWRMGGLGNEFTFINDSGFSYHHDARRLANGHITVYDNARNGTLSRGVEYRVDEAAMTVEKVAEFRNVPETDGPFQGNMQRLPNGNTIIGWGFTDMTVLTEFDTSGSKVLEFSTTEGMATYRAFRFPWQGYPTWPPALIAQLEGTSAKLYFSWNGSTETVGYKIYGGRSRDGLTQLATVTADGFETVYTHELPDEPYGFWYFRVVPIDGEGMKGSPSNFAHVVPGGETQYLPAVFAGQAE